MSRGLRILVIALAALLLVQWWSSRQEFTPEPAPGHAESSARLPPAPGYPDFLPPEALDTLQAIEHGGPFPYSRDGAVFQNREGILPERDRGIYAEYTVETPGSGDRGARRFVVDDDTWVYYSDDHYDSFRFVTP